MGGAVQVLDQGKKGSKPRALKMASGRSVVAAGAAGAEAGVEPLGDAVSKGGIGPR